MMGFIERLTSKVELIKFFAEVVSIFNNFEKEKKHKKGLKTPNF